MAGLTLGDSQAQPEGMNRRSFIAKLAIGAFALPAAIKAAITPKPAAGLSLAKIQEAARLLRSNDDKIKFRVAQFPLPEVKQEVEERSDYHHCFQVRTTVTAFGREPLFFLTLWDAGEDRVAAANKDREIALERTRRYWIKRDRWARKAAEALGRRPLRGYPQA